MNEKLLERKLREAITNMGGKAIKFSSHVETGLPDRLILMPGGWTLWAEIKTTGKKPTTKQQVKHEELRALGYIVEVIDSPESLEMFLNAICYANRK